MSGYLHDMNNFKYTCYIAANDYVQCDNIARFASNWCSENCEDKKWGVRIGCFMVLIRFKKGEDAVMFKLRFNL